MNVRLHLDRHPCFNEAVKGECGRVHLPVAPRCNIKCNYCNRKYDCVNESRPGVTSAVLSPVQAVHYLERVLEKEPRITVVGIAGPGDPMANPLATLETLRLMRERFPQLLICLATNGFGLPEHLEDLMEIGVSHVTVTVNAVDPEIGQRMVSWVRDGKIIYRGRMAAEMLLERQLESIRGLKAEGVIVKVNTIVVPGVNDDHVEAVARKMSELGVDILNCMPMYPNEDTPFAGIEEPTEQQMNSIRKKAEVFLPQMRHCTRCRADAVGLLEWDRSDELRGCLRACADMLPLREERPYVAVATCEGMLVNLHLGEADRFQIWERADNGSFRRVEERPAPERGGGPERWRQLAQILSDCRAILVSGIGDRPKEVLTQCGIVPIEMNGFIEMGLRAVYGNIGLSALKGRRRGCTSAGGCKGGGGDCS